MWSWYGSKDALIASYALFLLASSGFDVQSLGMLQPKLNWYVQDNSKMASICLWSSWKRLVKKSLGKSFRSLVLKIEQELVEHILKSNL